MNPGAPNEELANPFMRADEPADNIETEGDVATKLVKILDDVTDRTKRVATGLEEVNGAVAANEESIQQAIQLIEKSEAVLGAERAAELRDQVNSAYEKLKVIMTTLQSVASTVSEVTGKLAEMGRTISGAASRVLGTA